MKGNNTQYKNFSSGESPPSESCPIHPYKWCGYLTCNSCTFLEEHVPDLAWVCVSCVPNFMKIQPYYYSGGLCECCGKERVVLLALTVDYD